MCLGNRASNSGYYVNKQLEALWKISTDCVTKHGHGLKPTRPEVEYGTCLAQLCVGKHNRSKPCTEDLAFFATFDAPPQLRFICNHELILEFFLKSGHYKLEGRGSLETFDGYKCAFRVQYREHIITDISYSTFGQTESCKTKLLILDLSTATFLRDFSEFANGHKCGADEIDRKYKSIVKYLSAHYLPLLRKSGFHCIYSLPDFDNLSRTHLIDYSAISDVDIGGCDLFNINIDVINTFLKERWLEAAACVDELDEDHDHSLFGEFALAEHRGSCDDVSFHAFFGPPQILALCSKEVILHIDVQDLHFYLDGGFHGEPHYKCSNWKIAIAVEVHLAEEEGGCVKRLKLDLSRARHCEGRSICNSEVIEETLFVRLRSLFIKYITSSYLVILEEFQHHHIYRHDVRIIEIEDDYYVEEEETVEFSGECRERLCITETFGFDIITTVTQGSINNHLRCLWNAGHSGKSCLSGWELEKFFGASFGPPQIQFPCDSGSNTVIVYVDLREGYLTTLGHQKKCVVGEKHDFSGWKLAFEITVKLRDYAEAHTVSDGCLRERSNIGEYVLKQLVLDFSTVKFRQDLSRLPGLFDGCHYRLMRSKREALLHYVTRYYFAELKKEGHHVLYSIPTWKQARGCEIIRYAASSFAFQFYPAPCGEEGKFITGLFGHQRAHGNRNMLVMCGMIDHSRRPSFPLPRCSWRWSSGQDAFSGTIALSRGIFLEGWLLREFARINERTTVVPDFRGIGKGGEWRFKLATWGQYFCDEKRSCDWKQSEHREDSLGFEWRNKDEWTYAHRGDDCDTGMHNGGYAVSCETTNNLLVPTVSRHGACEIELNGRVDLKLSFTGEKKCWSTKATATWKAGITLFTAVQSSGLSISTSYSHDFSDSSGFHGDCEIVNPQLKDASTFLKEQLFKVIIIEESTIHELETIFTGVWPLFYSGAYGYTLCNPVFNSCGDLLFDLSCPLDRQGRCVVPGGSRRDICLPKKHAESQSDSHHIGFLEKVIGTKSFSVEGEVSLLTSTTGIDSPLATPPLDHALAYPGEKVKVREEHDESFNYPEGDVEISYKRTDEKVHHSFEGSDYELEDGTERIASAEY